MRLHKIVMRSGASLEVMATVFLDDPANESICFFQDEARQHLVAAVKRDQIAGIILLQRKTGVTTALTSLSERARRA